MWTEVLNWLHVLVREADCSYDLVRNNHECLDVNVDFDALLEPLEDLAALSFVLIAVEVQTRQVEVGRELPAVLLHLVCLGETEKALTCAFQVGVVCSELFEQHLHSFSQQFLETRVLVNESDRQKRWDAV